jgi:polygalacturonase
VLHLPYSGKDSKIIFHHKLVSEKAEFINVRNFGATGDGITDDTQAIAAAIASLGDGGTIYLPPGTYRLSAGKGKQMIRLPSNVTLAGAGIGATIIKPLDSAPPYSFIIGAVNGKNITIRELEIDGNRQRTGNYHLGGEGIEIDKGTDGFVIENVFIHDVISEAIDCDSGKNGFVKNVMIRDCGGNGLHFSHIANASPENIVISNFVVKNCAHTRRITYPKRFGGLCLRGKNIVVNNGIVLACARGIHLEMGGAIISNVKIDGGDHGIRILGDANLISGNIVSGIDDHGADNLIVNNLDRGC